MAVRRRARDAASLDRSHLRPRREEQLLLDALPNLPGKRILCTTSGRAQFAFAAAERSQDVEVECNFLDLYQAELAREAAPPETPNLHITCSSNLPDGPFDAAVLPFYRNGEAELARERMQDAYLRLVDGGQMWTAVDSAKDTWLLQEMKKLFDHVEIHKDKKGVLYQAVKQGPLRRERNFSCEFVFRDGPLLIKGFSRPGVFAHRRVDVGARKLMEMMEIKPGDRVLDLGCGTGAISLAAAHRAERVHVLAVDSNARALECVQRGAALNNLTNIETELTCTGVGPQHAPFNLVLANPPYYSGYRIAQLFLDTARASLCPGGRLLLVTKAPSWFAENVPLQFIGTEIYQLKEYYVISAWARG